MRSGFNNLCQGFGFGVSTARVAAPPVVLTPGPELWPQPEFDASTGLTLVRCSVSGGQLVGDGSETTGTATAALTAGSINVGDQFQYSFDGAGTGGGTVQLRIGGVAADSVNGAGTKSGIFTVAVVLSQDLVARMADNFAGDAMDNISVKKLLP